MAIPSYNPTVGQTVAGEGGKWVGKAGGPGGADAKSGYLGDIWDIQQGTFDPQKHPGYRSQFNLQRQAIDQGGRGAVDNILARTKPGGAQTAALANMYRGQGEQQAASQWGLESGIINALTNVGVTGATGTPWKAGSGMAGLGQIQQQSALANSQQQSAQKGMFGDALQGLGAAAPFFFV